MTRERFRRGATEFDEPAKMLERLMPTYHETSTAALPDELAELQRATEKPTNDELLRAELSKLPSGVHERFYVLALMRCDVCQQGDWVTARVSLDLRSDPTKSLVNTMGQCVACKLTFSIMGAPLLSTLGRKIARKVFGLELDKNLIRSRRSLPPGAEYEPRSGDDTVLEAARLRAWQRREERIAAKRQLQPGELEAIEVELDELERATR